MLTCWSFFAGPRRGSCLALSVLGSSRANLHVPAVLAAAAGPVASIRLPHALPFGLHGSWTADYLGPAPGQVGWLDCTYFSLVCT